MILEVNKRDLWHMIMGCKAILENEKYLLKGMGKWKDCGWGVEWRWNPSYKYNFLSEEELLNLYKYLKKNDLYDFNDLS